MSKPDILQSGTSEMYAKRNFAAAPATYTSLDFIHKIYQATDLKNRPEPVRILDSMSGPGLLGKGIQGIAPQHQYFYLDLVHSQLAKVTNATGKIVGDARKLPFREGSFEIGVIRYAAKDIPVDQQLTLFKEMYRVTGRGGIWVLADMYSPLGTNTLESSQIYRWLNYQHATKQEMGGRNPTTEGKCHIATEEKWIRLFEVAGFEAEVVDHHISAVTTTEWRKSNQVNRRQLTALNQILRGAPASATREFKIRQRRNQMQADYPVTIIRAVKL